MKCRTGLQPINVTALPESGLSMMKMYRLMIATFLACLTSLAGGGEKAAADPAPLVKDGLRPDLLGDLLPAGALARMGSVRLQDDGPMVFSPDGGTLIAASPRSIRFWDAATGKELRRVAGPTWGCRQLLLSPDGKSVACVGRDGVSQEVVVLLLDVATGKEVGKFRHGQEVTAVAFCAGGKHLLTGEGILLGGKDHRIQVREVATGKVLWRTAGMGCVLLADGKTVASLKPPPAPTLQFHDAATGEEKKSYSIRASGVIPSPDGKLLALESWDGHEVSLWDVAAEKVVRVFAGARHPVSFSPDGKALAYGTYDRSVHEMHLADVHSGEELCLFGKGIYRIGFAPDGKTLLAPSRENEGRLAVWDRKGKELFALANFDMAPFQWMTWQWPLGAGVFSPDGRVVASSGRLRLHLWDTATGKERVTPEGHQAGVTLVAFDARGKTVVSAAADNTFRWWEATTGKEVRRLDAGSGPAAISSDGATVAALGPDRLTLWSGDTGKELRTRAGPAAREKWATPHEAVAIAPGGRSVAWGRADNTIRLLDVASGKELQVFKGHETVQVGFATNAGLRALAYSPDGKLLVSSGVDQSVRLWDVASGKEVWRRDMGPGTKLGIRQRSDYKIVWAPDGKSLFVATKRMEGEIPKGTVFEIEPASGKDRRAMAFGDVQCFAVSPDGKTLAYSGYDSAAYPIILVSAATGKEVRRFAGHARRAVALAFSPDGKALVSGSDDSTLLVWDLTSPKGE